MSKLSKLYNQIVCNPKDVDFDELDKVLRQYGFKCRQPRKGSSHYIYHHPDLPDLISIPKARPVKAIYVKDAIAAIEKLKEKGE
ncbi:MAG: YcfA-like protein [Pelotomaculum sp. PtaU1.Bin035]|nr:MAG: YcfA-like protein [Pelotomaculum sp. PtaU1.Bin035]